MDWVEKNPAGTFEVVISLAKLAAVFAYIWTRTRLVEQEWEIRKQEYARKQAAGSKNEIGNEDMDGK
jgi:undecaprenyl pyrophosphate phosphatase UppP